MRVERVTDPADPALADYFSLTDVALRRRVEPEGGLYLAESPKVIERALRAGHVPRSFLLREEWLPGIAALADETDAIAYIADEGMLEAITGFHMHRGALAAMHRPVLPEPAALLADARLVVVLEDIVDHTNVGAIFRSAAGLGADAVLVSPRCGDPLYRRSVRVSMGTVLQVPWTRIPEWTDAKRLFTDAGFTLAALALRDDAVALEEFATDPPERVALLLGAEGDGLSRHALDAADAVLTMSMAHGVDSLNVAAASAVAVWAVGAGMRARDARG